jgi:hypothetical protein
VPYHFVNRISRHIDTLAWNALPLQVCPAPFRVRHQDVTAVIDHSAIHLFRDTVVIAPISGFHVINRNPQPFGYDCRQAAIRIPQKQQAVRPLGEKHLLTGRNNLANLPARGIPPHTEKVIGSPEGKLIKENVAQVRIKVLPRAYQDVLAELIQFPDEKA